MNSVRKRCIGIVFGLLVLANVGQGQQKTFYVVPEHPKEGDTIQFYYDARETALKDATAVSATLTGFRNFQWEYDRLDFTKHDSVWTTTYVLPEGMAFTNFVFHADSIEDKGGRSTYSYIYSTDEGKQVSGGMLGWGLLRSPHIVRGVPHVVDTVSYITDEVLLMWAKYELQNHPGNRFNVLHTAASALKHMGTTESMQKLSNELNALKQLPDLNEEHWMQILRIYRDVLWDTVGTREVEDEIRARFPGGRYVSDQQRLADFNHIQAATDDESRLRAAMEFIDKHPYRESDIPFNEANRISYVSAYWIISVYTSMQKDFENYKKYISTAAPYESLSNVIYRSLSVPFESQQSMDAKEIMPYTRVVLDRLNYYKDNYEGEKYATLYYANAALFAKILAGNELYEEAFIYASAAQSTQNFHNADLNETYTRILEALGKTTELQMALEKSYSLNQSSPYMLELLKSRYVQRHASEKGYTEYLAGLKDDDEVKKLKEKVQKTLINKPFNDFELHDQFGNTVRLSNQLGKIVILDFWASWCAPCKAAFPGMNLALEHFRDDPDVVFYFVNTQERKADMSEYVRDYMDGHDYPFTVLMDENSAVSKAAGVGAIPHKMVIGTDGRLRFSSVGYMGSPTELADEIIEMVNVLRAE